ncbi:hypothetical protein IE81DRAFT_310097 [Ceraceosorus guamensis]|uniref:GOLD domain-containing protein n=1 Tax=Ceraceosorus guamensis TaxID=1522189 RepID=A0A316WAE8_9BASI|nr:hypothetical protein IE81DRAFT_310097 [Ceraceosorus guamensis]PWN44943.1 hypothetical protein IE81DRAFT_310097 [Ceraceosorus guamensis]
MRLPTLRCLPLLALIALSLLQTAHGLYFYLDSDAKKCFLEELPNDTVVVGHYMAEVWDKASEKFIIKDDLGIAIQVKEVRDDHVVTSTRGPSEGKFAFTSHEAGDHEICLAVAHVGEAHGGHSVRMHLDVVIGESKPDNSSRDRQHIVDLAGRVRMLNDRLRDIRKEQQFQREREADFRDLSELTNSRAIWWSAIQAVVLIATGVWQLRHLTVFFNEKKLR